MLSIINENKSKTWPIVVTLQKFTNQEKPEKQPISKGRSFVKTVLLMVDFSSATKDAWRH